MRKIVRTLINRRRQPLKHRYVIDKETWHHHELVVKDQRILVMHKITGLGRVVYATNLSLELLWLFEVDTSTHCTMVVFTNFDYISFNICTQACCEKTRQVTEVHKYLRISLNVMI